jgi:hypothetical protein
VTAVVDYLAGEAQAGSLTSCDAGGRCIDLINLLESIYFWKFEEKKYNSASGWSGRLQVQPITGHLVIIYVWPAAGPSNKLSPPVALKKWRELRAKTMLCFAKKAE